MFNNLIESSSHLGEMKRRGSFLLFTMATYALLFAIAGVISIYAYDARLNEQSLEIVTMMPIVELPMPPQAPVRTPTDVAPAAGNHNQNYYERQVAMAPTDRPDVVPTVVSTLPNRNLPLSPSGIVRIGPHDSDPGGGLPGATGTGGTIATTSRPSIFDIEAPPVAAQPKPPKQISKGVITSEAISLPKPAYPPIALQAGAQGRVAIQVLLDEKGKVISAHVLSGHPLLAGAAVKAAYLARFSPTLLSGVPVKVSGVITYNFERN